MARTNGRERVVLAAVDTGRDRDRFSVEMAELEALAQAAGGDVVARVEQRRAHVDSSSLLGRGKVHELQTVASEKQATLAVTLNALRPRQRLRLEQALHGVMVVDRSVLILDIFAMHARSSEGKLQVELAQLRHRAANLIGSREELSRLGGGIGTRGPGETKLEVDRRRIRLRIARLESELGALAKRRSEQRRSRAGAPVAALVGYTNAGKSSLLNALSGARVYVADQPFASLDPTLRRIRLPNGESLILADTVGFISDLPHELVSAFRATLEEVTNATLLLHVMDATNPYWERQRASVKAVLAELGAQDKPLIYVWNKIDALPYEVSAADLGAPGVLVSAKAGLGLEELRSAIGERLSALSSGSIPG